MYSQPYNVINEPQQDRLIFHIPFTYTTYLDAEHSKDYLQYFVYTINFIECYLYTCFTIRFRAISHSTTHLFSIERTDWSK